MKINKTFLDVHDIQNLFGVGTTMAYKIITNLNEDLESKKIKTFRGKVLARHVYSTYGMKEELDQYTTNLESQE